MIDAIAASENPAPSVREDLKAAIALGVAAAFATALVFPYLLDVMPRAMQAVHMPLWLAIVLQSAEAAVLLGLLSFCGLRMGLRAGLRAPWLSRWARGGSTASLPPFPWLSTVAIGIVTALCILLLTRFTDSHLPPPLVAQALVAPASSAWHGFLASFYGGIAEEIELRLFFMTLLVWLIAKASRRPPSPTVFWLAILLAALLFGAGHLPAAAKVWPLDSVVIARTIGLNALAGLAFGWLYWRRGIETAMLAHFCADIILHVLGPLLASNP